MARRSLVRVCAVGGAALLFIAAGASAAVASTTIDSEAGYRTAMVGTDSITELLALTGQIESASRRDESFSTAGEVASVAVAVGDRVTVGQELATLDTESLQDAVDSMNDRLAQAQQQLEEDLEAQTSTSTSTSSQTSASTAAPSSDSGSSSGGGGTGGGGTGGGTGTVSIEVQAALDEVTAKQQTLLDAMTAAATALAESEARIVEADTVCDAFATATIIDPTTGVVSTDPAVLAAVQTAFEDCQAALAAVKSAQAETQVAQADVATAATALDVAVTALRTAVESAAASGSTSGTTGSTSTDTGAAAPTQSTATSTSATTLSASGAGGTSTASVPSAADIVADQAAIDAAAANVEVAKRDLGSAVLTSAIAGTVAQVAIAAGDSVSANSDSAVITVLGDDGYLVETTVTLAQVAKIEVGQTATVRMPATGAEYPGAVTSVGVLNVSTDSATPSYTVRIGVEQGDATLLNGAAVSIDVEVATAPDVIAVPLSAVTAVDGQSTVTVIENGSARQATVTTGAVGDELIEILSGLEVGQVVALADLDQPMETESEETTTGLSGLGSSDTAGAGGFSMTQFDSGSFQAPSGGTQPGLGG